VAAIAAALPAEQREIRLRMVRAANSSPGNRREVAPFGYVAVRRCREATVMREYSVASSRARA
jgi:hypothetical protein